MKVFFIFFLLVLNANADEIQKDGSNGHVGFDDSNGSIGVSGNNALKAKNSVNGKEGADGNPSSRGVVISKLVNQVEAQTRKSLSVNLRTLLTNYTCNSTLKDPDYIFTCDFNKEDRKKSKCFLIDFKKLSITETVDVNFSKPGLILDGQNRSIKKTPLGVYEISRLIQSKEEPGDIKKYSSDLRSLNGSAVNKSVLNNAPIFYETKRYELGERTFGPPVISNASSILNKVKDKKVIYMGSSEFNTRNYQLKSTCN